MIYLIGQDETLGKGAAYTRAVDFDTDVLVVVEVAVAAVLSRITLVTSDPVQPCGCHTCSRTESVPGATVPTGFSTAPSSNGPALGSNSFSTTWTSKGTAGMEIVQESELPLEILVAG